MNTIPDDSTTSDSTITQCSEERITAKKVGCKIEQIDDSQTSATGTADVDPTEQNGVSSTEQKNNTSKTAPEKCQPSVNMNEDIKMNDQPLNNAPKDNHEINNHDTAAFSTNTLSRKTLASSARRGLSKNDNSPSRNCYEFHWKKLAKLTATQCSNLQIAVTYECKAVRTSAHHKKAREKCWASMFGGGMIGTYDTKEEAIKRAVWYVIAVRSIYVIFNLMLQK